MRIETRPRRLIGEPIIPLINIVFLLLVFLMIAGTPDQPDPFGVDPARSAAQEEPENSPPVLYVSHRGELAYGRARGEAEILAAIAGDIEGARLDTLFVKADGNVDTGRLIALMEQLKAAGARSLRLVTRRGG